MRHGRDPIAGFEFRGCDELHVDTPDAAWCGVEGEDGRLHDDRTAREDVAIRVDLLRRFEYCPAAARPQSIAGELGEREREIGYRRLVRLKQVDVEIESFARANHEVIKMSRAKYERARPVRQAAGAAAESPWFERSRIGAGLAQRTRAGVRTLGDARNSAKQRAERTAQDVGGHAGRKCDRVHGSEAEAHAIERELHANIISSVRGTRWRDCSAGERALRYAVIMRRALLLVSIAAGTLYFATASFHPFPGSILLKGLSVGLLAVLAYLESAADTQHRADALLLGTALLFSSNGDVLLDLDPKRLFIAGLAMFLLAHIVYIVLFVRNWPRPVRLSGMQTALIVAIILYAGAVGAWLVPSLGSIAVPVMLYMAAITMMVVSTVVARFTRPWVVIGAILFLTSDSLLAVNKFKTAIPLRDYLVWGTYYLAQLSIAAGFITEKFGAIARTTAPVPADVRRAAP